MWSLRNRIFNNESNPGNTRERDSWNVSPPKVIMDANRGMDQRRTHLIIMQPAAPRSTYVRPWCVGNLERNPPPRTTQLLQSIKKKKKKTGPEGNCRWRMHIDYTTLNTKTVPDAFLHPNISEILDQLGVAKYFSLFHLAPGFYQIPMKSEDAPKISISTSRIFRICNIAIQSSECGSYLPMPNGSHPQRLPQKCLFMWTTSSSMQVTLLNT